MTTILSNLARNLIQLNALGDAEQILRIMESIDRESGGSETALIAPLRKDLRVAIETQKSTNKQTGSQVE
jgi:hypothetical protein